MEIILNIIREMWNVLGEMSIYLMFGFLIAGILSVLVSPATVERHLGGKGLMPIIKATMVGVPLPLCSCGVIPVATSIRKHGASRGATIAFLISTPETGIDSILVTYSLLGGVFAILRPLVAGLSGFIGGILINFFDQRWPQQDQEIPACQGDCCNIERSKPNRLYQIIHHGFVVLPADIGKSLMVGILIAGLIGVFVPTNFFSNTFMSGGIGAMLVMLAIGIPSYVCASASVPMAMALIAKGVSPGAALVFLISGPATNAAAIATIWKIMGSRTTAIYLLTTAIMALLAGITLDYIFTISPITGGPLTEEEMIPSYIQNIASVVFLGILIGPAIYRKWGWGRDKTDLDRTPQVVIFDIQGMRCPECAESVENALLRSPGVQGASVELKSAQAKAYGENIEIDTVIREISNQGFTARVKEEKSQETSCGSCCDRHQETQ
jgi:uncharacterized membrane protein YraQ (UPF0718 family)/copper chaperone CopZ